MGSRFGYDCECEIKSLEIEDLASLVFINTFGTLLLRKYNVGSRAAVIRLEFYLDFLCYCLGPFTNTGPTVFL